MQALGLLQIGTSSPQTTATWVPSTSSSLTTNEALSSCEKKKKSWCDFWPLWKSNNWAKLDTHTTSSKWSLTIWDTAVSRKNWNFTQQNDYTLGRKLKNGFALQKDHLATTKFNFKSGEEDVEDWLWKKKVVWCQSEPSNERAPLGQQQLQNMGT